MVMRIAGTYEITNRAASGIRKTVASHVRYESLPNGLDECAIPLGADDDGLYLIDWRERHAICSGITGAGKTESVLNTTILLNALRRGTQANLFVIDAKGDCFEKTAPILATRGYTIRNIDLRPGLSSDRFNPIHDAYSAYCNDNRVLAQELAGEVAEGLASQIAREEDHYWDGAASALLQAVILALMESKRKKKREPTLADVSDLITQGAPALSKLASDVSGTKAGKLLLSATSMRDAKETLAGVLSCALQPLAFYRTMVGMDVAGASTFDVYSDLGGEDPVAYYLCVAGDASEGARIFGSMLFDHIFKTHVRLFGSLAHSNLKPRPMRCVWDEFPQFKAVGSAPNVLATARGYDFLVMLAIQSTSQLVANYGVDEARVILSQCEAGLFMRSVDEEVNREVALRTVDAVTPAHLVDLKTGEAYFAIPGQPAAKVKYTAFDCLVERCGFETRDLERSALAGGFPESISRNDDFANAVVFGVLLEQCKIATNQADFSKLAQILSQRDSRCDKDGSTKCATALADALEYAYMRGVPDCRRIISECMPSEDDVNPYLGELYAMALSILFEIGRKGNFLDVVDDLMVSVEAMATYIENRSRAAVRRKEVVIDDESLLLGKSLDQFARIVNAAQSDGIGVLESFKAVVRNSLRMHLLITRRILEQMDEREAACGVPLMRRISLPGSEGDQALNCLRAIRVFGFATDYDEFERIVSHESQPALWSAAKTSI